MRFALMVTWFLVLAPLSAGAQDVVKLFKSEALAVRFAYHYELLDAILERSVATHGPYVEQAYRDPVSIARSHRLAVEGELINVYMSDAGHALLNDGMIAIPVPIDKGLLGYRVALIDAHNQAKIDAVDNLEELKTLIIGQGATWGDLPIYEHNHVPLEIAPSYELLFEMLMRGRLDLFPRGITEAPQELQAFRETYPGLAIDRHLLIKYPFGQFIYVSKSAPHLVPRIRAGLDAMIADGSFEALFDKHFAETIRSLELGKRTVIELENPFLPAWAPVEQAELWLDWKAY